uniref:Uncharacterized protein n=1 Tax=Oryza glumipatula TaxID=40148 RepID=A0A0E0BDY1_9ORYZ
MMSSSSVGPTAIRCHRRTHALRAVIHVALEGYQQCKCNATQSIPARKCDEISPNSRRNR